MNAAAAENPEAEGVETRVSTEGRGAPVAPLVYPEVTVSRTVGLWKLTHVAKYCPACRATFSRHHRKHQCQS